MRQTDPFHQEHEDAPRTVTIPGGNSLSYTARRILVGSCPECGLPVVVFNDRESWPLVACPCGWADGTDGLANRVRIEEATMGSVGGVRTVEP